MLEPSSLQQVPAVNNNAPSATSQTRAFSTIFLIENVERFGFYGMQALIVYYMVQRLNFPDERAVWGAASARSTWLRHWRLGGRLLRHAPHDAVGRGGPGHRLRVDGGARRQRGSCSAPWVSSWSATGCSRRIPATWCARSTRVTIRGSTAPSPSTTWRSTRRDDLAAADPGSRTTSMNGMATAWAGTSRLRCARSACCWAWAIPRSPAIRN